jgi:hypothetical protein
MTDSDNAIRSGDALRAALTYARDGWPVFPCKPGLKEPDTRHGFKDASTDPDRIGSWWRASPDRNVAIATGAPGPDVLDVDVHPGGTGFAAFNKLRRAGLVIGARALVRTPSGGFHAYFTGTSQPCGRVPRQHLDFRASGGYVVAPPSVVGGKPYAVIRQQATATELDWAAVKAVLRPPNRHRERGAQTAGDVGRLAAWVARLQEGNRNAGLFWAACRAVEAGNADAFDELAAAAATAGLSDLEIRRTIGSARRGTGRSFLGEREAEGGR